MVAYSSFLNHNVTEFQLSHPLKLLFQGPFLHWYPLLGLNCLCCGLPFGASLAWVTFSWVRRGVTGSPASFLLQIPQFLTRFSALDLLNLCNFCGVLTLMFISNGILGSVCVTSFWLVTCSFNFLFFAFSFFVFFSCFLIFYWRASSIFFSRLSLSITSSENSLSWPSASSSMKSPSSNWTSCCLEGGFASLVLSPLKGSLGVDGGPSWVGDRLTRLSGGDRQGSSVFLDIVPLLKGSLGVGSRPISEAGLVGRLSKLSTHFTLVHLGSSASGEAFLFCCHWGTSFSCLTSCGCSGLCVD